MNLTRQLTLLASLTAKLMLAGLATLWVRTKQQPRSKPLFCASKPNSGPTRTVQPWSIIAMADTVECGTPEERINLGTCDRHPSAKAGAMWANYTLALNIGLCGHCDNEHREALADQGFERAWFNMDAYRQGAPA